jgi:GT2 family glycosyltransferase
MSNSAETTRRPRVCALLTSFNRRDKTVSCLQRLGASAAAHGIELSAVLVDDGSTDGTAALVSEAFDWVHVIVNQAEPLFWCRGMHRAFAAALEKGYDHYLLLNDDTMLDDDALPRLLSDAAACASRTQMPVIVVGSTRDSKLGTLTYGGQNRPNPGKYTTFVKIEPAAQPRRVETFNANVVLVPTAAAQRVGNLDPYFEHALGDIDYGLRATAAGVEIWLAGGFHGTCDNNSAAGTFKDADKPIAARWRHMLSRKGLPWRSWLHFTRRHATWRWPLFFAWPYCRFWLDGGRQAISRRRS